MRERDRGREGEKERHRNRDTIRNKSSVKMPTDMLLMRNVGLASSFGEPVHLSA